MKISIERGIYYYRESERERGEYKRDFYWTLRGEWPIGARDTYVQLYFSFFIYIILLYSTHVGKFILAFFFILF